MTTIFLSKSLKLTLEGILRVFLQFGQFSPWYSSTMKTFYTSFEILIIYWKGLQNMSYFRCWKNLPFVVYFATFKLRFAEFRHLRSWFFPSLFVSYRYIWVPNISSLYQTEIKLYGKLHDLPFVVWTKKVTSQKNHLCHDSHGL